MFLLCVFTSRLKESTQNIDENDIPAHNVQKYSHKAEMKASSSRKNWS